MEKRTGQSLRIRCLKLLGLPLALALVASHAQELSWTIIVNNAVTVPGTTAKFNSYNQPAVNNSGLVVFRARGRAPVGGEGDVAAAAAEAMVTSGVYLRDMAGAGPVTILANRDMPVPAPNNTLYNGVPAAFTEFPSSPRLDVTSSLAATRGQSEPVYSYLAADGVTETRVGTSGIFANPAGTLITGAGLFGAVKEVQPDTTYALTFPYFSVPEAPAGTRFDQFPGSPTVFDGAKIAFKGNWTDPTDGLGKTGVYFRDLVAAAGKSAVTLVASSSATLIPGTSTKFGATAGPSAASGYLAFTGWDIEEAPTLGGVFRAPATPAPTLQTLAAIGGSVPGEPFGALFRNFGEGLSISEDARFVAFWGTWGEESTIMVLTCPPDGNADLLAYCNATYPTGFTVAVPVHQGIFVVDAQSGVVTPIVKTNQDGITDFLYWTFSGRPPGVGGTEEVTQEPPRWRSAAFAALAAKPGHLYGSRLQPSPFQVAFKARRNGVDGIYLRKGGQDAAIETAVETLLSQGQPIDPQAPLNSIVTAVAIERDGFRHDNLAISVSMLYETVETSLGWAGLYLSKVPSHGPGVTPAVALGASPNPSNHGEPVTFTAMVSGTAGAPTGGVRFADGTATIPGCAAVAVEEGTANCTTAGLSPGSHEVTAVYSGDSNYQSGSANVNQTVSSIPAATVSNLSTRAVVGTGDALLIGGFIIGGPSSKTIVVRARGPSLSAFGIASPLANPTVQLVRMADQATIATNDDWGSAANAAELTASGFAPSNSAESAILMTLAPGAYTALVAGSGGSTGVAIVEIFEVDHPEVPLVNISTRGQVQAGEGVLIGGFTIQGSIPRTMVIRARGPSLMAFGVPGVLANPSLQLVRSSDQALVASNDDYTTASNLAQLQASGFAPTNAFESAIMATLAPGAYTAVVRSADGGTGLGIIEVFPIPLP